MAEDDGRRIGRWFAVARQFSIAARHRRLISAHDSDMDMMTMVFDRPTGGVGTNPPKPTKPTGIHHLGTPPDGSIAVTGPFFVISRRDDTAITSDDQPDVAAVWICEPGFRVRRLSTCT